MRAILLALFLGLAGCASNYQAVLANSHHDTVTLLMRFPEAIGKCSGTAIAPHVLLTAKHCLVGAQALSVDGEYVAVKNVYLDGNDHALVVVDRTFTSYAEIGTEPGQGVEVFIFGNPGDLRDQYRHGWVSGYSVADNRRWTLYDLNGFFGDSGSGIFDGEGRVVGVISVEYTQVYEDTMIKVMGSLPLAFTPKQWGEALHG